jgi:hypothetical protein
MRQLHSALAFDDQSVNELLRRRAYGFTDKHLRERIGKIVRMNPKTRSLDCDGEQWRVAPALLRKVIDL